MCGAARLSPALNAFWYLVKPSKICPCTKHLHEPSARRATHRDTHQGDVDVAEEQQRLDRVFVETQRSPEEMTTKT